MSTLLRDQVGTNLFGFVWRHSRTDQIMILIVTLIGLPLLYLSLELPKIIVNDAIEGQNFPRVIQGYSIEQIPYLMGLCGLFLLTVIAINGVKWVTNVAVGMTGERMLRRLRFSFFQQTLRFPPRRMAGTRPGEVVQSVMAEIEPLGGFVGEIFATPISQGGMLLVMLGFIFVQDPLLGLAASAMLPVQAILIPWLQKRVIRLNRERALNNRRLADTLASAVGHMPDIRGHGLQRWHMAAVSGRLHTNTEIRKAIFRRKFTIKMVNNLLNQVTPFLFFAIGGSMVIRGQLDLGALVAVLTAYKDIGKPWREVLNYYQRLSDFRARFQNVAEAFAGHDLMPAVRIEAAPAEKPEGALILRDVEAEVAGQQIAVPELTVQPGQTLVLSGGTAEMRQAVMRMAGGLEQVMAGTVQLGETSLGVLTPADLGTVTGIVDSEALVLSGSMRRNLEYVLYRASPPLPDGAEGRFIRREAQRTGMPLHDPHGDWVDASAASCDDRDALRARMIALADGIGMTSDLVVAALGTPLGRIGGSDKREALETARAAVAAAIVDEGLDSFVEHWAPAAFAENLSLLENILFALPDDPARAVADFLGDRAVAAALARAGALDLLADIGADLARAFAGLLATVSPDSPLLDRVGSYIRADILAAAALAPTLPETGREVRDQAARKALIGWAARYTTVRDRLDVIDDDRRAAVMAARAAILEGAPLAGLVRLDTAGTPGAMTVTERLLRGRRRENRRAGWRRLEAALIEATTAAGLRETLIDVGLDAPLDATVSAGTRQRIALMRVALKQPQISVIAVDGVAEDAGLRQFLRKALPETILLLGSDTEAVIAEADIVAQLDDEGRVTCMDRAA